MMIDFLSPDVLLSAYSQGFFPMASSRYGEIYWHYPEWRAIFPLNSIKVPKSMKKELQTNKFTYTINGNFKYVIEKCAKRDDTWISDDIIHAYLELHNMGFAHSVETWHNGKICGGLYGVALGAAFFGESMFNDISNASKAAFYYLINHLLANGYELLDSQYLNPFTEQLGAIEIPQDEYLQRLNKALLKRRVFHDV